MGKVKGNGLMNLRKLALTYLGWCPGVEAAAKFVPNKEISSVKLGFLIIIIFSLSGATFFMSQVALGKFGLPMLNYESYYGVPQIFEYHGKPFLAFILYTDTMQTGVPSAF